MGHGKQKLLNSEVGMRNAELRIWNAEFGIKMKWECGSRNVSA